jgi:hypothetical protein
LIRHASSDSAAIPILALPVTMVLSALGALLVTTIGTAALLAARWCAAGHRTVTLSAVTMGTDPEHRLTPAADPLPKHHLVMACHSSRRMGLDNGNRSWQGRTIL